MKISYNWLKWYVPEIPEADKLAAVFGEHLCEVESVEKLPDGDTLYDLNILPNRAHDLLSFHGVARELAGQLGLKFNDPTPYYKVPESKPTELKVNIETPNCRRYMARIVRNVKVGPSPEWVVNHLASVGQRSINNIVDATNLVMLDCGQPTHAFDLRAIKDGTVTIGSATDGETLVLVGSEKLQATLKATDTVILSGGKALALGGVKGGLDSGIQDDTTDILIEVANFQPTSVRKTARRLSIFSDAAKRFENDLSPEHAAFGMLELTGCLIETNPDATFEDVVDVYPNPQTPRKLTFSIDDVNTLLGSAISADETETILKNYGYAFTKEGSSFTIDVPPLRLDLTGTHDMAEEIGRIYGYAKISPELPKIDFVPKTNETQARINAAREKLLADGYSETMTYTFTKKGKVEVARGAKGKEFLRTNLSDGLKAAYDMNRLNAPLLGVADVRLFEIGTVFLSVESQEIHVAYADKKGVVESTLEEFTRDMDLGVVSTAEPKLGQFIPWSQYPFIYRDIALWVPENTGAAEVAATLRAHAGDLLAREPQLFDQFAKDGRTSLAFRLVFQSHERTLVEEDVVVAMAKVTEAVTQKGWEIR